MFQTYKDLQDLQDLQDLKKSPLALTGEIIGCDQQSPSYARGVEHARRLSFFSC
jgi:hypothetical protein